MDPHTWLIPGVERQRVAPLAMFLEREPGTDVMEAPANQTLGRRPITASQIADRYFRRQGGQRDRVTARQTRLKLMSL